MISERTKAEFERSFARQKEESSGAGGSANINGLIGLDKAWEKLRSGGWKTPGPKIVSQHSSTRTVKDDELIFDVAVAGGTLGIFYALALQKRGFNTCVIERGKVVGRPQEWNISGKRWVYLHV